jgi:hypothetical protein
VSAGTSAATGSAPAPAASCVTSAAASAISASKPEGAGAAGLAASASSPPCSCAAGSLACAAGSLAGPSADGSPAELPASARPETSAGEVMGSVSGAPDGSGAPSGTSTASSCVAGSAASAVPATTSERNITPKTRSIADLIASSLCSPAGNPRLDLTRLPPGESRSRESAREHTGPPAVSTKRGKGLTHRGSATREASGATGQAQPRRRHGSQNTLARRERGRARGLSL